MCIYDLKVIKDHFNNIWVVIVFLAVFLAVVNLVMSCINSLVKMAINLTTSFSL